jgi:hypothetical protein
LHCVVISPHYGKHEIPESHAGQNGHHPRKNGCQYKSYGRGHRNQLKGNAGHLRKDEIKYEIKEDMKTMQERAEANRKTDREEMKQEIRAGQEQMQDMIRASQEKMEAVIQSIQAERDEMIQQ